VSDKLIFIFISPTVFRCEQIRIDSTIGLRFLNTIILTEKRNQRIKLAATEN